MKVKKIMLVKKEYLLPEIGIFKKINVSYWKAIFKEILREAERNKEDKSFLIISDYGLFDKIKKVNKNVKLFEDYVKIPKVHIDPYTPSMKIVKEVFDKIGKINFEGVNLSKIVDEELAYNLISIVDEFEIIEEINKKEKPEEFIVIDRESTIGKAASLFSNVRKINAGFSLLKLKRSLRRHSLGIRMFFAEFIKHISNREFTKTGNATDNSKKLLFAAFDKNSLMRTFPLIEMAINKKKNLLVLANYKDAAIILKKKRINFASFGDFLNSRDKINVRDLRKKLIKNWREIKKKGIKVEYHKRDIWKILEPELEYQFYTRFPWVALYTIASSKLAEKNIGEIILHDDLTPRNRSLIFAAKSKKIPTLVTQVANMASWDSGRGFTPLMADVEAVWGESSREYLKKFGIDLKRVEITGCPRFDNYSIDNKAKEEVYEKIGVRKDEGFFLFASQPFDECYFENKEKIRIMEIFAKTMEEFPDKKIVIKLHPREKEDIYREIVERFDEKIRRRIVILKDFDILELVKASDLLITISSTTAIEAVLLKKPIINIDVFNCRSEMSVFKKFNMSKIVTNEASLIRAIKELTSKKDNSRFENSRTKFLRWYFYKLDGKASERVFKLIERIEKK